MSLQAETLYGTVDKVADAIATIKQYEPATGYEVGFSGGKDSQVVWDLVKRSGVKATSVYCMTTVDPPELVKFIRTQYPEVVISRPTISMYRLIIKKMMPPTRLVRFCCDHLKERKSLSGATVQITGIRKAESARRSKRQVYERCLKRKNTHILNPIIEWSDEDVWAYLDSRGMPHCSLYDEGWSRIGCVMCPNGGRERMLRDAARWPNIANIYRMAFAKASENRKAAGMCNGGEYANWCEPDGMWNWWLSDSKKSSHVCGQKEFTYGDE